MNFSLKHLLGSVAIAALVTVAACDQSEEDKAADATAEEAPAEGADAGTIAGADDSAAAGCQAAADALGVWTGKPYEEAKGEFEAGQEVASIRVIRPGEAVTKDFRPDRLNVELDEEGKVTRVYCG